MEMNFTIFANQAQSAKFLPSKIIIWAHMLYHYQCTCSCEEVVVERC